MSGYHLNAAMWPDPKFTAENHPLHLEMPHDKFGPDWLKNVAVYKEQRDTQTDSALCLRYYEYTTTEQ